MTFDPHKDFAASSVATAPSPATSGTSLVVASGDGSLFPNPATDGAFNCTVQPANTFGTIANAEIIRVTARSGDTFTISRTQEGTSARSIVAGDAIGLTITAKMFTDIEAVASSGTGMVKLFDSTLLSAAASIDTGAGGIAAGHGDLLVLCYGRAADINSSVALNFNLNGDAGANYDLVEWRNLAGSGSSVTAHARTAGILSGIPASTATANYFGMARAFISTYDKVTAGYKVVEGTGGYAADADAGVQVGTILNTWRSTAAITRLAVSSGGGGNLLTGSRLAIWGTE